MPKYLLYPLYDIAFSIILITTVPKEEIRRLSIYGIIFGGMFDVIMLIFGNITGFFGWINHGPLGYKGIQIFSPVSWAIYFILYYYFLPKSKPLNYIYMGAGIAFSIIYTNLVRDLGIFHTYDRFFMPLISFSIWFSIATWGFYKLNHYIEKKEQKNSADENRRY